MTDADYDLLQIKERLTENLSSAQIADTLDELIYRALDPLVGATNILESTLIEVLPFTATNKRRRFSSLDQDDLVNHLFSFIVVNNRKAKLDILRRTRMERTLYFKALTNFEAVTAHLPDLMREYTRCSSRHFSQRARLRSLMEEIASFLNCKTDDLWALQQSVRFWHHQASQFKQMVCEKYVRLANVETKKAMAATDLTIDEGDLWRDLIASTSKAIDKYDSKKGPLTSYIQCWFMDAKTQAKNGHEYGVAFSMPVAQRKRMLAAGEAVNNITVELNHDIAEELEDDGVSVIDTLIGGQESARLQRLAAAADPHGFAVLLADMPFHLSDAEKDQLRATLR